MSLIEQAAKRLQQLKQAGVDISAPEAPSTPAGEGHVPTPEAVVRALEDRGALAPAAPAAPRQDEGQRRRTPRPHAGGEGAVRAAQVAQVVPIDLDRLKAQGYVTPDAPTSRVADEFRVIKRPIIQNAQARSGARLRNGNLVMVTSALPGEGKTFTGINLAISVAMEYDNTVLLVDGDVSHPQLPDVLGLPKGPGLLDLLTGSSVDVADALIKTNIEKLTVMPAGTPQRRATELIASEQMARLLEELASRYPDRIIIFDSPPLLVTTEARVMASHMGQIVLVVGAESTTQHTVQQALATIDGCEVVLMMLNKAGSSDIGSYYGYYGDAPKNG